METFFFSNIVNFGVFAMAVIDCGPPDPLHNGFIEGSSVTLDSMIYFKCLDGMTFKGDFNYSICRENGTWSNPTPQCLGEYLSVM